MIALHSQVFRHLAARSATSIWEGPMSGSSLCELVRPAVRYKVDACGMIYASASTSLEPFSRKLRAFPTPLARWNQGRGGRIGAHNG
jgi:hypothetical protein